MQCIYDLYITKFQISTEINSIFNGIGGSYSQKIKSKEY